MKEILKKLRSGRTEFNLRTGVPYSEITSLGAGGRVPVLAEPLDDLELGTLLKVCRENSLRIFVLSAGTNLVGMDRDFDGVVIRLAQGDFIRIAGDRRYLAAGCGVRIADLARYAAGHDAGGLAALCGIPGALGGALRMNAGASGDEIGRHVIQVVGFFPDGAIYQADGSDIEWGYRCSSIPDEVILTVARLRFELSDAETEQAAIHDELEKRRRSEPQGRSAGCMFKNVSTSDPAGKLIDGCGLKGVASGAVEVSAKHANYLLNRGGAAERDVVKLMSHIRRVVAEKTGFYLRPELVFMDDSSRREILSSPTAPRVLVLYGGISREREISLKSGNAVHRALLNAGFNATLLDVSECRIYPEMRSCDVVYPVLHGGFGEDGTMQKLLEAENIPFVGSVGAACGLVMDKIATKKLLDQLDVPTAPWGVITRDDPELPAGMNLPAVLKVPDEGSTFGIELVRDAVEYRAAAEKLLEASPAVLVEEFISGVEITVAIVNGELLPAVEIHTPNGFYDFDAKYVYKNGHTEYYCPVRNAAPESLAAAGKYALEFFHAAGCRDILRVDFIIGADGVPYMLEGNAIPGCTATSLVPKAAQVAGMSFEKLVARQVDAALKRSRGE